ncbi:hypothetical protein MKP05_11540 [Halomonas sp. EGI 63088]|uniref:Uncharacterized protein n=1 Tax=Halomonas flagellata TaxID=2920385 RepID=A0ABS9RVB6_9GAMM|nr:hypothetical protein [Halomonas flagellata]MCH4563762.1 hypothetical protein [Halomonas flagellata]
MIKTPTLLLATALLIPSLALGATLELPGDARVEFQVIDSLHLSEDEPRHDDLAMRPVANGNGTHQLPEYCVAIGDARLDGERIRVTAKALTCIETDGSDSEIYSGEISAAAYEDDGSYGVAACDEGRCVLEPSEGFLLQFAEALAIEQQDNPSAQINEQRRQAEGAGVANPIPAESPDPDDD